MDRERRKFIYYLFFVTTNDADDDDDADNGTFTVLFIIVSDCHSMACCYSYDDGTTMLFDSRPIIYAESGRRRTGVCYSICNK